MAGIPCARTAFYRVSIDFGSGLKYCGVYTGIELPDDKQVQVWDSTAEIRYLVIPERPAGTEGWREEQLAELVTRDSMIGTGLAKSPA